MESITAYGSRIEKGWHHPIEWQPNKGETKIRANGEEI
jgi:hypothetical protein